MIPVRYRYVPYFLSPVVPGVLIAIGPEPESHKQMHYNPPVRVEYISYVIREEGKVYLDAHVTRVHQVTDFVWKSCIRFHLNDSSASEVCWYYDSAEQRDLRYFAVLRLLNCEPPEAFL